jgi:AcrR family transcriptional regulator
VTRRPVPPPPGGHSAEDPHADLTARARIGRAALELFARDGYDRSTIRAIASRAGVSPGLVRHHYGSKGALREWCDRLVFDTVRRVHARLLEDPGRAASMRDELRPLRRYVVRALIDGSKVVSALFDEMVGMTEQWMDRVNDELADPPLTDLATRATLVTAMALGIPMLHEHVSRHLGQDVLEPEGDRLASLALLDIYSRPLMNAKDADVAAASFGPLESRGGA